MRRDSDPALLLLSRFIFYHSQESLVSSRSWAWHISQGSHLSLETDGSGDFSGEGYFMGSLLMKPCPEGKDKGKSSLRRSWNGKMVTKPTTFL